MEDIIEETDEDGEKENGTKDIKWDEPSRGEEFLKIEEAIQQVCQRMEMLREESEMAREAPEPHRIDREEEPLIPLVTPEIPVVVRYARPVVEKNTDIKDEATQFLTDLLTQPIPSPAPEFPPPPKPVREAVPLPHDSLKFRIFQQ